MTHLTMEQLLALRDGLDSDPGMGSAGEHLEDCDACRQELEALHQRAARLKALPTLRPARDRFPAVMARLAAERRRAKVRRVGIALAGLAAAASVVLTVWLAPWQAKNAGDAEAAIANAKAQSQMLEQALQQYRPELRVQDGRTAVIVDGLQSRIAEVDRRLQRAELLDRSTRQEALMRLWQERVGLMDALVDVHVTRARNVGL